MQELRDPVDDQEIPGRCHPGRLMYKSLRSPISSLLSMSENASLRRNRRGTPQNLASRCKTICSFTGNRYALAGGPFLFNHAEARPSVESIHLDSGTILDLRLPRGDPRVYIVMELVMGLD